MIGRRKATGFNLNSRVALDKGPPGFFIGIRKLEIMKRNPIASVDDIRITGIELLVVFVNIIFGTYLANQISLQDFSSLYLLRYDRILHFFIGFFVGLSMRRGLVFAASLGLGKECWDHFFGTGFDMLEVFITGFGGIFGYIGRPLFSNLLRRIVISTNMATDA